MSVVRRIAVVLLGSMVFSGVAPVAAAGDGTPHGDWPFRPLAKSPVPDPGASCWPRGPVDAFVFARLAEAEIEPGEPADRATLLRRITFDLTGLPPSREAIDRFQADSSPDAFSRVVDRLLASPQFGVRWAQHWLDLVRFAETEGFKSDNLRPAAYRYRDYVIRSINADRPYDEFLRQQIAGDELEPDNPDALVATGLNRLYPDEDNAANLFQRRNEILNDVTETNGLAILGLTIGCARCHDHKYDAISQADYYRMRAFFAAMVERHDLPAATPEERRAYARQYAVWDAATRSIRREMDRLLAAARKKSDDYHLTKFRPEIQRIVRKKAAERTPLETQIARMALRQLESRFKPADAVKKLPENAKRRYAELKRQLAALDHLKPDPLPMAMAITDVGPVAPPTHLLLGGSWRRPDRPLEPGFPSLLGAHEAEIVPPNAGRATTGRRSALAQWLTRPDHPLTARVIVNRLWQHHFGRGIVATPNDFGVMGDPPSHPRLLDWLAVQLVEHRWSLKYVHRQMLLSATYRLSSKFDPGNRRTAAALRVDRANRLLWRGRRRRLEAEAIRDAMLAVAGTLNLEMFGPSIRPRLPEGVSPRYAWQPDPREGNRVRRSLFVLVKRNMRYPMFDAFDWPDLHNSCGRRSSTTTAPQALVLLNGELALRSAQRWAARLDARFGDQADAALVRAAYRQAFGREPRRDEVDQAGAFLRPRRVPVRLVARSADLPRGATGSRPPEALVDFCQALLNANEFLFID